METAKLTKEEDEFWEDVYNQLVRWGIHEDLTYDICFAVTKAKFRRLWKVEKFI